MKRLLRGTSLLFVVIICASTFALAAHQSVVITKDDVVLRAGASKFTHKLAILKKGRHLRLLDLAPKNNYYHVETFDSEGWVSTDVAELLNYDAVTGTTPATPPPPAVLALTAKQTAIENFQKIASNAKTVTINGKTCPAEGHKDDPAQLDPGTNLQKNRTDTAEDDGVQYLDVKLESIRDLPFPAALRGEDLKNRNDWTGGNASIATEIARFEGVPVRVKGYLAAWRDEGAESCNCEYAHVEHHDVHLAFTANAGEGEQDAVVMELTPRVKRAMKHWKHSWLKPSEVDHRPIRISGWLMLDPKHPEMIGDYRHTLWEVHPITKLEVMQGGAWVDIEDVSTPE
jgi:hypothetical protein